MPQQSSQHPNLSPKNHFNTFLSLNTRSCKWRFQTGFHTKSLRTAHPSPILATCSTHHSLPDSMTQITLRSEYKSCSFSLRSFLQSPVRSSLLGPTYSQPPFSKCFSLNVVENFHTHVKETMKYFPLRTQNNRCHERCLV